MNKKDKLYSRITKHGQDLKAVFNLDQDIDPVKLCKRLLRLETKAHKLAVDFCNGVIDQLEWDKKADQILTKVETILNSPTGRGVINKKVLFLNGDARGYALKIDDEYIKNNNFNIHRDWGGYGIIAPDFREFN
jgi:hypothetical protein|tara:strand:+ start:810 stop:1211 length:402 start_codon:yes stop_codon:yes gene_type:complete